MTPARPPASKAPVGPAPNAVAALVQAADALALGLLLLTDQGRLLHANAAGQTLLAAGGWLRLQADGMVVAGPDAPAAQALRLALTQAAEGRRQWLRAPAAGGAVAGTASGAAVSATLVRLPAWRQGEPAALLMTVTDPGAARELASYAAEHALTPAESRVLAVLCQGLDQASAAAALGVTLATLRSHVAAVRRKTGHRRLATLLQAVARLPPLAPPQAPSGDGGAHSR